MQAGCHFLLIVGYSLQERRIQQGFQGSAVRAIVSEIRVVFKITLILTFGSFIHRRTSDYPFP